MQNQAPSPFPDALDWTISGLSPALAQPLSFSEAAVLFEISFCAKTLRGPQSILATAHKV